MTVNTTERGFIKTAWVRIAATRDTSQKAASADYFKKGGTQFFFNSHDSGFISFSHSIGWNKEALTQCKLEVIDPGNDFEQEFIAGHYFNRSANSDHVTKSYFIAYGVGKDSGIGNDANPHQGISSAQLAYLIKIDIDVRSDGARKYTLLFGSLPSLKNNPSSQGWPVVDEMNRVLLTAGRAGFNLKDVKAELGKPSGPSGRSGFRLGAAEMGTDNVIIADPMVENWIRFLDEGVNLSIKRYIENITGLGPNIQSGGIAAIGNVIVLMPSFRHTTLVNTMEKILSADDSYIRLKTHTCDLINTRLFKNFPNLQAYNLKVQGKGATPNWHSSTHSSTYKAQWRNALAKDHTGVIVFKADESAFKKDKKTKKDITVDWMKPLEDFGNSLHEISTVKIKGLGVTRKSATESGEEKVVDIPRANSEIGHYDWMEIRDRKRLSILKKNGLIGRDLDYCFIWGEKNMQRLFLGILPSGEDKTKYVTTTHKRGGSTTAGATGSTTSRSWTTDYYVINSKFYNQIKSLFPGGWKAVTTFLGINVDAQSQMARSTLVPTQLTSKQKWRMTLNPDMADVGGNKQAGLKEIFNFVNNDKVLEEMSDGDFYNTLDEEELKKVYSSVADTIKNSGATVAEIGRGNYVPILRSNVRNANVTDLRLMMNPHYWGDLAGIVESMTVKYNKQEAASADALRSEVFGAHTLWKFDALEDMYLKTLGYEYGSSKRLEYDSWKEKIKEGTKDLFEQGEVKHGMSRQESINLYKAGGLVADHARQHLAKSAGLAPQNWNLVNQDELDLIGHIFSNFYLSNRDIYKKSELQGSVDVMTENLIFYEKLYSRAGPQMDVTTYPMFMYSRFSDLGQGMWVEMRQPSLRRGRNPEADVLSLDKKIEKQHLELGTGLYFIKAFEHTISSDNVRSRFRLFKNAYTPVGY